ncbi:hypothetical protein TorRG33x02_333370 [Trema orientale]|uniref:Uncharacterized protein n=1 Tax=Trema orientale TaxID=63057 RepID=A0A2P5B4G3_TREOI|nr:hypothetical protein TorRG33x02_333370 [Trema orientale]
MGSVVIFLNYNGKWDDNNVYHGMETTGILIPNGATYARVLEIVFEALDLRPNNHTIEMKYVVDERLAPIKIVNDRSVKVYMELKKNEVDKSKYPLFIHVIDEPMTIVEHNRCSNGARSLVRGRSQHRTSVETLSMDRGISLSTVEVPTSSTANIPSELFENCKWSVRATQIKQTPIFQIRRYNSEHTCSVDSRQGENRQATSYIIGDIVKYHYSNPARKSFTPNDIMDEMKIDHGVNMGYHKAWRAKEKALEILLGTDDESYASLPTLAYMLETSNPGSVVALETEQIQEKEGMIEHFNRIIVGHCSPHVQWMQMSKYFL